MADTPPAPDFETPAPSAGPPAPEVAPPGWVTAGGAKGALVSLLVAVGCLLLVGIFQVAIPVVLFHCGAPTGIAGSPGWIVFGYAAGIAEWVLFSKFRKARAQGDAMGARKFKRVCLAIAGAGTALFIALLTVPIASGVLRRDASLAALQGEQPSPAELARIVEIIQTVAKDPEGPSAGQREEFWAIFRRSGTPPADIVRMQEELGGSMQRWAKLYWEDARRSIAAKTVVRSADRRALETSLVAKGLLSPGKLQKNEAQLDLIARGLPLGEVGVVTTETIDLAILGVDVATARLRLLFTPPEPPPK